MTSIVQYFVRADVTCDWIELDHVVDIRLVQPWTQRPADELVTNTIGAGSRPSSESSLALNGRRFRTTRAMRAPTLSGGAHLDEQGAEIEVPPGTIVTVTLANPDATAFVLTPVDETYAFVLQARKFPELLDAI